MRDTYFFAKKFLVEQLSCANAGEIVESYLISPDRSQQPVSISELYRRLLQSGQNANMKATVIGGSLDGFNNLGKALFNFDPVAVDHQFESNPEGLLPHIVKTLNPRGKIRNEPRSIWPKYCRTILSAAKFLLQFEKAENFYDWANHLYCDSRSMAALPMILAAEIEGIGYPLACDFLKDLGFLNYGKPDVHMMDIFIGIGLCDSDASAYQMQKIITQIAEAAEVSAYNVDKLFWLIGSGKFNQHPHLGKNGLIGRKKLQFVAHFNAL